jgi:hypothetical protein
VTRSKRGWESLSPAKVRLLLGRAVWAGCAILFAGSPSAWASTDVETGVAGANGANATTAGAAGQDGQAGGGIAASVGLLDVKNSATATGGNGGNGGSAIASLSMGGAAGSGGAGGSAGASFNFNGLPSTGTSTLAFTANSIGGRGGSAGQPGNYLSGNPGPAGIGGQGGAANSFGTIFTTATNFLSVNLSGTGGAGGASFSGNNSLLPGLGGDGGSATIGALAISAPNSSGLKLLETAKGGVGGSHATSAGGLGRGGNGGAATMADLNGIMPLNGGFTLNQNVYGGGGGSGYAGGNGGNAIVTTTNPIANSQVVEISVFGGPGGSGGTSGAMIGANGGNGGDATLNENARVSGSHVRVVSDIYGGQGGSGNGGGYGGNAYVVSKGSSTLSSPYFETYADGYAIGGDGGFIYNLPDGTTVPAGLGGSAYSSATSVAAGDSQVTAHAYARAGANGVTSKTIGGPLVGWAGATARVAAFGSNLGTNTVDVIAEAYGGSGGAGNTGGPGGAVTVDPVAGISASGRVTLTVTLTGGNGGYGKAQGGDGSSVFLSNVASGTTSGALILNQTAIGGNSGSTLQDGVGGAGGDAFSTIALTNTNCASLNGTVTAIAGAEGHLTFGTNSTGLSGRAGTAFASIWLAGAHDVTAAASAQGGSGGSWTAGSVPAFGPVYAMSSGGGAVSVTSTGTGGASYPIQGGPAGIAASVVLNNSVDGDTSGSLTLTQSAIGGEIANVAAPVSIAGGASSVLTVSKNLAVLSIVANATGGQISSAGLGLGAGSGGAAYSSVNAVNSGGAVNASARSTGGNAYGYYAGGSAIASAVGMGAGTNGVTVIATAIGGTGSGTAATNLPGIARLGIVQGISTGGGNVTVSGVVGGGMAYSGGISTSESLVDAISGTTTGSLTLVQTAAGGSISGTGSGGSAVSMLTLSDAQAASLNATTNAFASTTGTSQAVANITGLHGVVATAKASGLVNLATATARSLGGPAQADAITGGTNGVNARSMASTSSGMILNAAAGASSLQIGAESRASIGLSPPSATNITKTLSMAFLTAAPAVSDSIAALTGHAPLMTDINLGQGTGAASDILGLVTLAGPAAASVSWNASVDESVDLSRLSLSQHLIVGLLNSNSATSGPTNLHFSISRGSVVVVDRAFTSIANAKTYFNGTSLDLGSIDPTTSGKLDLHIELDASQVPQGGFSGSLVIANATPGAGVPEPSGALLTVLAGAGLLGRRKRKWVSLAAHVKNDLTPSTAI